MLAAADIEVFTRTTTFAIMQSLRLDLGLADQSTPDQDDVVAVTIRTTLLME